MHVSCLFVFRVSQKKTEKKKICARFSKLGEITLGLGEIGIKNFLKDKFGFIPFLCKLFIVCSRKYRDNFRENAFEQKKLKRYPD